MSNSRTTHDGLSLENQLRTLAGLLAEYSPKLAKANFDFHKKRAATYYTVAVIYATLIVSWYVIDRMSTAMHLQTLDEIMIFVPTLFFFVAGGFFFQTRLYASKMQKSEISRLLSALSAVYNRAVSTRDAAASNEIDALRMMEADLRIVEAEVAIREARDIVSDQESVEIRVPVPSG